VSGCAGTSKRAPIFGSRSRSYARRARQLLPVMAACLILGAEVGHASETPHIKDAIDAARRNDLDPRVLLAIGWHESRLNPAAGQPKNKGRAMSSAVGMWQILAARDTLQELGIAKQDRTNYARSTPALANYLSRQQDRLRKVGLEPTPGRTYMTWNVGPGMASAILGATSGESIDNIARRALAKYGPKFIGKWLRNNPSLYRPGMTAGQVAANYELQMKKDMKAVERYLPPSTSG
jgi:soluble lytic murein transglycosylase-like protein